MIYHIVTGDLAANPLKEAMNSEPAMEGEIVVIKDVLSVGPLQKPEDQKFSEMRRSFWQEVAVHEKNVAVDDLERLLDISLALSKDDTSVVWLWMAPLPADVCTYLWALKYLGRYPGRFLVINIAGLPFLDENGKVHYPKSIADIRPKELVKARRLARPVTASELEVDGEEWRKLMNENAAIRTHEGGKRLSSKHENYYDNQLVSFCSNQFQKASKVIGQAMSKNNIPTGDYYLGWRLRKMAETGRLQIQGDITKGLKDFEIKLPEEAQQMQLEV